MKLFLKTSNTRNNMSEESVVDAIVAAVRPGFCYLNAEQFPCSADSIVLVALGLAASGLGLIMVIYFMHAVRTCGLFLALFFCCVV